MIVFSDDEQELLSSVFDYYQGFHEETSVKEFLYRRRIYTETITKELNLGFSNRTLGQQLPNRHQAVGKQARTRLKEQGVYNSKGKETFSGCLVVPITDTEGRIINAYGRKCGTGLRKTSERHLVLNTTVALWNIQGLQHDTVIICKSMMDALTFYAYGHTNVTSIAGIHSLSDYMPLLSQLTANRLILSPELEAAAISLEEVGKEIYQFKLPPEMDVNKLVMSVPNAEAALDSLLRHVEWKGGVPNKLLVEPVDEKNLADEQEALKLSDQNLDDLDEVFEENDDLEWLAKSAPKVCLSDASEEALLREDLLDDATQLNAKIHAENGSELIDEKEVKSQEFQQFTYNFGDRQYRVRGLDKNLTYERLKINLLASRGEGFHVDILDLYSAKNRQTFINQCKVEMGVSEEAIKKDLGKVLMEVEQEQHQLIQKTLKPKPKEAELTPQQRYDALDFLKSPRLIELLLEDLDALGIVGEETNKLAGYLAATSRLLPDPLAILVQSMSSAGKSTLMQAILDLMPEEQVLSVTKLTAQSLYYLSGEALKHKILAIAEDEGIREAAYALKLLQSEGKISIASTGKDGSGEFSTQTFETEGPVMLFLTTTSISIDEELSNRCLVLTVNESREHTDQIHQLQRQYETLEGLKYRRAKSVITEKHKNAQKLLEKVHVVNPYADQLTFRNDKTRTRRDQKKYLALIRTIALLHQYQRPRRFVECEGESLEYIEVAPSDIELANRLSKHILGQSLDELPPQSRNLLNLVSQYVEEEAHRKDIKSCNVRFTRKDIRYYTGWGNTQLFVHLKRLEQMEYLLVHAGGRGQRFEYELLFQGDNQEEGLGLVNTELLQQPL